MSKARTINCDIHYIINMSIGDLKWYVKYVKMARNFTCARYANSCIRKDHGLKNAKITAQNITLVL